MFFLVGRVLGKRRQGLFGPTPAGVGGEEGLEFGYCFDVRLLFRLSVVWMLTCGQGLDPRVPAHLGLPLHPAIPVLAADRPGSRGVEFLRQYDVPCSAVVLLRHHVPGL